MTYPNDIYVQRELENLPGLEFDSNNKKTLFAEDILGLGREIEQIEETLGLNLSNIEDLINYIVDGKPGSELPVGSVYTTTVDLDGESPFDYGTWVLLASGQLFGDKTTYSYERTA